MPEKIPSWQWTHTGAEVLLLKCVNADGTSYGGFKYPLEIGAEVTAPDWIRPTVAAGACMGGHGASVSEAEKLPFGTASGWCLAAPRRTSYTSLSTAVKKRLAKPRFDA